MAGFLSAIRDGLKKSRDALSRELKMVLGGGTLTVLHTPGHTPGSVVYRADGFLFTGDTLFDGSVGRTDLPGGDAGALRASLCRLAALPPETVICPGHGGTSTIGRQIRTNPFL